MMHQRGTLDFAAIGDMADQLIFDFSSNNINLEYIICEMLKDSPEKMKADTLSVTSSRQTIMLPNENVITNFIFSTGGP